MIEVTVTSILDGVKDKLFSLFPNTEIWIEEIKQGFEAPCFFVKLLTHAQDQEMNRRYKRFYSFDIHFFPEGNDYNREAHEMAEKLYDALRWVGIDGARYKGTGMNYEIVDGTLHFFVDFNFHVMAAKQSDPKMKTLEQEGYLKNG
ncbi:hypothetical protein QYF50_15525 [Paenibacillus vini]|uniref:phage tail terminator family protein n=1 Tax=Paenibacillus vini TaxID=1476024 RepID=UPI0025B6E70E|nr:hypothetical protein [Paenibacillus vini]MDN4069262.1 hypothetical protein [Paenibacillus vini]MDN4069315.1 hypothetical protein [Paenibacillus vini]